LDLANEEEGFVTMKMVMEALPQFGWNDVVRVRGSLHSTKGLPAEYCKITEVILIQHHGLVVGDVSTLSIEDALFSPAPPSLRDVANDRPQLIRRLEDIFYHLPERYDDSHPEED
jgi:hypothetical protein